MPQQQDPREQLRNSVQDREALGLMAEAPIVFYLAGMADSIAPWPSKERDLALDAFWKTESMLAGAVYSMVAKVAALDFRLKGPRKTAQRFRNIFLSADFGAGWVNFITKVITDVFTQDNGGFIEVLRSGDSPTSPVVGLAHLDSQRCIRTGNPRQPVIYTSFWGERRDLQWYQVIPLTDLVSPREDQRGHGFCAVSRILREAQTTRDISYYKRQKLSGKRIPAIMFVQGIRRAAVKEAVDEAIEAQVQEGMTVYTRPIVVSSPDPGLPVGAQIVELAGLPDGYDEDVSHKWYIAALAMCFGTDYTEFAPLPGGNLGSATQATVMASRARGKGPGVILQQIEYAMNWCVLPPTLEFQFASTDPAAERDRIELAFMRARERSQRVKSGELTPEQALELAVSAGDAPESFLPTGEPSLSGDSEEESPGDEEIELIVREIAALRQTLHSF